MLLSDDFVMRTASFRKIYDRLMILWYSVAIDDVVLALGKSSWTRRRGRETTGMLELQEGDKLGLGGFSQEYLAKRDDLIAVLGKHYLPCKLNLLDGQDLQRMPWCHDVKI